MSLFHRHKWTDWAISDRGVILYSGAPVGWYLVQQRHCLSCGKTQVEDQAHHGNNTPRYCDRRSEMQKRAPRKDGVSA